MDYKRRLGEKNTMAKTENIEDTPKKKKKDTILKLAIACIIILIIGLPIVKKHRVKKEYKALLEKKMEDVQLKYDLSKVDVQVFNIKKGSYGDYILETDINCQSKELLDEKAQIRFSNEMKDVIGYSSGERYKLANAEISAYENGHYYTTVNLNGDTIIEAGIESIKRSKSSSEHKCTICRKEATTTFQNSWYCEEHYKDAITWTMDNIDKKREEEKTK